MSLNPQQTQLQFEAIRLLVRTVFLAESPEPDDFDEARLSLDLADRMVKRLKGIEDEGGRSSDWWPVDVP